MAVINYKAVRRSLKSLRSQVGSAMVGFIQAGTGAVPSDLQRKAREVVSVFDFMTAAQIADVQAGTLLVDVRSVVQAALDAHLNVYFPPGSYRITTSELTLRTGHHLWMSPAVTIRQYTADKNIFKATQKDNVWIIANGATLRGEGSWSGAWTGVSGHEDRGIQFLGCTNSGIVKPRIINCAVAGIAIVGGENILIDSPRIEGTHEYGVALSSSDNNQIGIYLTNHATYGNVENVRIVAPDISGVCQGICEEAQVGIAQRSSVLTVVSPVIHDIPGQHGMYMQMGGLTVSNPAFSDIALSAVKLSGGDANLDMKGYSITGVVGKTLGGSLFELDIPGSGSINDAILSGCVSNAGGYGIGISGKATRIKANVVSDVAYNHAYLAGADLSDIDVSVIGTASAYDGILVTATNSTGIKLRPTLRNPNTSSSLTGCGITIASASADVEIFDPDITDANTEMIYGLFSSIAGSTVKVRGSVNITGAADTAVRATGTISEWPTETTLSGTNGEFTSLGNITSSQPIVTNVRTTSASNATVWAQNLPDECVANVEVTLSGKLADSSQRATYKLMGTFYRDAAGVATQQGATTVLASHASGSFGGAYSLTVDGANGVVIVANSGGVANYDWTAVVKCAVTT